MLIIHCILSNPATELSNGIVEIARRSCIRVDSRPLDKIPRSEVACEILVPRYAAIVLAAKIQSVQTRPVAFT